MKITLNILGLLILLLFVSCKKDKTVTNGYDPNFINLVDYDSEFIGKWGLMPDDYDNTTFTIPEHGNSNYSVTSMMSDGYQISKVAKYNDHTLYLGEAKKFQIDQDPILVNDTLVIFNWVSGESKIPYSAIMILNSATYYRFE